MSTLVRRSGIVTASNFWGTRQVLTLNDGSCVVVVSDPNATTSVSTQYGDRTGVHKVHIYHSVDRATWTLRASVTVTAGKITANVAPDNTIGVYSYGTDKAGRYFSVSPTWVASAVAVVHAALASTDTEIDMDLNFTAAGVPVVVTSRISTSGSQRHTIYTYCRRTSDSAWVYSGSPNVLVTTTAPKAAYGTVSALTIGGVGDAATTRRLVIAAGSGTGTTDNGVQVITATLNETTGLLTAVGTVRETIAKGLVPSNSTAGGSRNAMLFSSDDGEYTLGVQHYEGNRTIGMTRGTWDGTTWTRTIPWASYNLGSGVKIVQYNMAMTYSSDRLAYHYSVGVGDIMSSVGSIDSESNKVSFRPPNYWDNRFTPPHYGVLGGTGPNTEFPTHDTIFLNRRALNTQIWYHHYARPTIAPKGVVPTNGQVVPSSVPVLQAKADIDLKYSQTRLKLRWEFASDVNFTTNLREYEQADSKYALVNNTDAANAFVPFSDVLDEDYALTQGNWFVRAAHVDEFDVIGAYSPTQVFSVFHPPAAADISPANGKTLAYNGFVSMGWKFTDPYVSDVQTAYQIEITSNADGSVIADTGKVVSGAKTSNVAVPTNGKDILLQARIKLWDIDDVEGNWSGYVYFRTSDAPVNTITAPVAGTINTAIPVIQSSVAFTGDRKITSGRVIVKKGTTKVHDSGPIALSLYNGDVWNWKPPIELLANATAYTFEATVTDSGGLTSPVSSVAVTTSWTPPAVALGVTANVTPYNTEGLGYLALTWDDTARDPDFSAWNVWRRIDYVNPTTGTTLETGTWVKLASVSNADVLHTYKDYTAPSGYRIFYKVEQEVIRFGDVVTSTTAPTVSANPVSQSYWLIQPDTEEAFQLGSVVADAYTDEYEEEEFNIPGRGRHVDVGERLGYKGTLEARVRDGAVLTARQRKLRLERIKKENRILFLRNPYGDTFRVAVQTMSYTRIAGTGLSEFFDLSIPYLEIGK